MTREPVDWRYRLLGSGVYAVLVLLMALFAR